MANDIMTVTRGDLEPDIVITVTDTRSDADFTGLTAAQCRVLGELGGQVVLDRQPDTVTPSQDGKSAIIRYSWQAGDTDLPGRMYVRARVNWPGVRGETFPRKGTLRVDIRRKPGDA